MPDGHSMEKRDAIPRFNLHDGHGPKRARSVELSIVNLSMHLACETCKEDFELLRHGVEVPASRMPMAEGRRNTVHAKLGR